MTRTVDSYWICALLVACFLIQLGNASPVVAFSYTPSPIEHPETAIARHVPLAEYLAGILEQPVRIHYERSHSDIIQLFRMKKVDLVQMGPLPYVKLRESCPQAVPLAIFREDDGMPSYSCVFITAFDGPKKIEDFHGPIATVQPLSTCGPLSVDYMLKRHGLDISRYPLKYLGNQDNVALAVVRGEYAVGGIKKSIAAKYASLTLQILDETPQFPGLVLIGNADTLTAEQLEAIRDSLLALTPADREGFVAGKYGFAPVTDSDYQMIRDLTGGAQ